MNASRRVLVTLGMLIVALTVASPAFAITAEEQDALNAAERWLVPVDAGKYADAWAMAAATFKAQVDRQAWRDGARDMRKSYGRVVVRKAERLAFVGEAPPNPTPADGTASAPQAAPEPARNQQVAILFETKFAGNKTAAEQLTVVREQDGIWRVAGYFIR